MKATYEDGMIWILKTQRLSQENYVLQILMQERITYIQLFQRSSTRESQSEN